MSVLCVAFMKQVVGVVKMCLERVGVIPVTVVTLSLHCFQILHHIVLLQ